MEARVGRFGPGVLCPAAGWVQSTLVGRRRRGAESGVLIWKLTRRRKVRRVVHAAVLLWAGVFFGIVAPGHTRGYVEYQVASLARPAVPFGGVDASCQPAGAAFTPLRACCQGGGAATSPSQPGKRPTPPGRCAICQIVATLDCPPPFVVYEHLDALLGVHAPMLSDDLFALETAQPFAGRAPPAIA